MDEVILDQRDQLLLDAVSVIDNQSDHGYAEIAVVDGADHVPVLVRHLFMRGYRPVGAELLTVFTLIEDLGAMTCRARDQDPFGTCSGGLQPLWSAKSRMRDGR